MWFCLRLVLPGLLCEIYLQGHFLPDSVVTAQVGWGHLVPPSPDSPPSPSVLFFL